MAKVPDSVPWIDPSAVVRATTCIAGDTAQCLRESLCCTARIGERQHVVLTHAVCEEGMPPEPITLVKSHRPSAYQCVNTLRLCAMKNARNPAIHGLQRSFAVSISLG